MISFRTICAEIGNNKTSNGLNETFQKSMYIGIQCEFMRNHKFAF